MLFLVQLNYLSFNVDVEHLKCFILIFKKYREKYLKISIILLIKFFIIIK